MPTLYLKPDDIKFEPEVAARYLRLGNKSLKSRSDMLKLSGELLEKYRDILKPVIRFEIFRIREKDPESLSISFHEGFFFSGKGIFRLLRNSDMAAVYLVTLGGETDRQIQRLEEDNFFEAYIFDSTASAILEAVQMKTQKLIEEEANKEGFHLTKRFSPGYTGWDISEQGKLVSVLKGDEIKISLTEASLMFPQKSVSGIYGIEKD